MQIETLELISYKLCPYVQRSVITLREKGINFTRTDIELASKPHWFTALSPTGKVPLLRLNGQETLFESAVICEFLNDITGDTLLPTPPLERAKHRSWIEYASQTLAVIGQYYSAKDKTHFERAKQQLRTRFETLEKQITLPYFSGSEFMLVDAAYAPVFRYFDVFEKQRESDLFNDLDKLKAWRKQLTERDSVKGAVAEDFDKALVEFVVGKGGWLAGKIGVNT